MNDNQNPDAGRDWENDPHSIAGRDWAPDDAWDPDPDARPPAGNALNDDLRRLSEAEEGHLHFHGHPHYNMRPLHDLCFPGGCRYKTEAENCADLEAWYRSLDREARRDDPEAEL